MINPDCMLYINPNLAKLGAFIFLGCLAILVFSIMAINLDKRLRKTEGNYKLNREVTSANN